MLITKDMGIMEIVQKYPAYELHGIVDTQPGIYRPSGSIEINRYISTRVGRIEIKQLCFYNIRCIIIDRSSQKDYTVHH